MALKTFTKEVNLGTTSGTYGATGTLKLTVVENSINSTNNTSNVTATLQFIISPSGRSWRASSASWGVSGYKTASGNLVSMQYYSGTTDLWSQTFDVAHDSSTGNATISFNISFSSTYTYNGSDSLSCTLTNIPRYAKITSFSVSKRDETSVTYSYTVDSTCDFAWYSKDDGNTWNNLPNTGIVSGLTAGTTYNFKLRVRRQDSQLLTISDRKQQSTYDYPKPNTINNFTIGNAVTINLYNPLGRSITLDLISNNNGAIIGSYSGTRNGDVSGFNNQSQIDTQYASIPNATSGTYYARVTYGSTVKTKGNATYSIKGTETPVVTTTAIDNGKTLSTSISPTTKTTDLTGDNKKIIKFVSDVDVSVSATAQNSSTISSYSTKYGSNVTIAGQTHTYTNVESTTFTGYATDSRGLSGNANASGLTLIDYIKLTIDDLELYRQDETGSTLYCRGNGNYFSGNFGATNNSITFQIRYKESSSSTWSSWSTKTMTIGTNTYSFDFQLGTNFDYTKTYNIQVKATDKCMATDIIETSAKPGIPVQGLFEDFHEAFGVKTFEKTTGGIKLGAGLIGQNYSLDEVKTGGVWVDGKDIYRKCFKLTNVGTGYYPHDHNISNFGDLVDVKGYWKGNLIGTGTEFEPIPNILPDNVTQYSIGISNITTQRFGTILGTSIPTTNEMVVVLEYTKSTS